MVIFKMLIVKKIVSFFKDKEKTKRALIKGIKSFENIMPQFLSILVIIGISLTILKPETISTLIGNDSGILGVVLSSLVGSVIMMPTFVAFSTGNTLIQNGAGYAQVSALITTLTMVGVLTFPLEAKYIGKIGAFYRNFLAFLFSFVVAFFMGGVFS